MPTLIHLNGPPGAGKSTLARLYADDHRGVLDLDIDTVVSLIGGWRDDFFAALGTARSLALAMAEAHLRAGIDVVMPQLVTDLGEAARFEEAAARAGAGYVEIALTVCFEEQSARFGSRRHGEVTAHIHDLVAGQGGPAMLHRIGHHLGGYLGRRPEALRIDTSNADENASYAFLLAALGGRSPSGRP